MKQVLLNSHSSLDVQGFEFYNYDLPQNLDVTALSELEPQNAQPISVDGRVIQEDGSFILDIDKSNLNFEWNIIVSRSDASKESRGQTSTYLAMLYWDSKVPADEKFGKLRISYLSKTEIITSSDLTSLTVTFINHTKAEAIPSKGLATDQFWIAHPQLDVLDVNDSSSEHQRRKVDWNTEGKTYQYRKLSNSSPLTGYTNSLVIEHSSGLNTTSALPYRYECIPDFSTSNIDDIQLLVSARYGVGLYSKSTGNVTTQNPEISFLLCPCPEGDKKVIVYNYGLNVTLFYYPDLYQLKVSCKLANQTWEEPWIVGGDDLTKGLKVVVPSYVDIIPFVFVYMNGNWNICHILSLTSNPTNLMKVNTVTSQSITYTSYNYTSAGSCPVELFFSDKSYINPYMWNSVVGYEKSYAEKIRDYWLCQLYTSFETFIQALRFSKTGEDERPQMLDCGIQMGDSFIFYSQDAWGEVNIHSSSSISVVLPNLTTVDNFLAYNGSKIVNLLSGSSIDVSNYNNVQMKHGVVIGFTEGGKCEQLQ